MSLPPPPPNYTIAKRGRRMRSHLFIFMLLWEKYMNFFSQRNSLYDESPYLTQKYNENSRHMFFLYQINNGQCKHNREGKKCFNKTACSAVQGKQQRYSQENIDQLKM